LKKGDTLHSDFIDILFENRNKSYGAYYLRKHEYRYLIRGFLFSCSLLTLFLCLPFILQLFTPMATVNSETVYIPTDAVVMPKGILTPDYIPPPPPHEKLNTIPVAIKDSVTPEKKSEKKADMPEPGKNEKNKDSLQKSPGTGNPNSLNEGLTMVIDERPTLTTPQYKSFQEYIRANTKLPEAESIMRHSGRVIVTVFFNADGVITKSWVSQGLSPLLNQEALRVVNAMPRVNPARSHGKAVPIYLKIPVDFAPPNGIARGK
jgi:protein TonB